MGLARDHFTRSHKYEEEQSSILRLLYYPPSDPLSVGSQLSKEEAHSENIRAGAHSDYGSLTLLFQKDVGGLQILLPSSPPRWLDVPVTKGSVLVNIGDAFDFWTAGRFPSTVHRVVAPRTKEESVARFSIAYFLQPTDSELLVRIPLTEASDTLSKSQADIDGRSVLSRFGVDPDAKLTAKEWLLRRLGATYASRKEETA